MVLLNSLGPSHRRSSTMFWISLWTPEDCKQDTRHITMVVVIDQEAVSATSKVACDGALAPSCPSVMST